MYKYKHINHFFHSTHWIKLFEISLSYHSSVYHIGGYSHILPPDNIILYLKRGNVPIGNHPDAKRSLNVHQANQVTRTPHMATSNWCECVCEGINLHPVSHLLVKEQLCIKRGRCNKSLSLYPGQIVQLLAESNLAHKFLKNPNSCMSIWLPFWY